MRYNCLGNVIDCVDYNKEGGSVAVFTNYGIWENLYSFNKKDNP